MDKELSKTAKALLEYMKLLPKGSKIYSADDRMTEDIKELFEADYMERDGFGYVFVGKED